ncbi:hypothetical protein Y1Q_0009214 [Alligator mississippiensis]|uniref:Uncharacterized protein n=1 Tax=Alligator mississippiensis TaxID=8496 RepID=A0A151M2V7_ALLMI|nr:hypothetical protein Y1Q_0009214 [Alligator mississippiensis]
MDSFVIKSSMAHYICYLITYDMTHYQEPWCHALSSFQLSAGLAGLEEKLASSSIVGDPSNRPPCGRSSWDLFNSPKQIKGYCLIWFLAIG